MNKKKAGSIPANLIIAMIIIVLAIIVIDYNSNKNTDAELAKCIGSKSVLYSRTGCPACKTQEDLFGNGYKYLTKVDCLTAPEKCMLEIITATPTWVID